MSKQRVTEWRFTGKKDAAGVPHEYHTGIPARNLDADDVAALSDDEYKTVELSKLYVEKSPAQEPKKTGDKQKTGTASTSATSAPKDAAGTAASAGADAPKEL